MSERKKPTRTDLIRVVAELQGLIGKAMSVATDRNPNREAHLHAVLMHAHDLCIDARGFDPAEQRPSRNGWNFEPFSVRGIA